MERLTEGLSNSSEQDNQSTYQELVKIRDKSDYLLPLEERGPADFKSTYQGLVDISDQSGYLLPVEETRPADCQSHAAVYSEPSSPKLLTVEETRPANCQSDNQTIGKSAIYSEAQSPQPPRDKQRNEDYQYDYAEPDGIIVLATIRTSLENLDSLRDPDSQPEEESYVETREADIPSSPISTTVERPNFPRSSEVSSKGPSQDNNCNDSLQADGYIEVLPQCDDSLQAEYYIDVLPDSESGT
ncbi:uncharacterized protein LOC111346053 isoform X2 [Stylophora pistillata]|uniref:uncharacterized protein LOC111346053 isoform X2 n=1 Tax=Stylophora pistillata TaxID=50429 RepID=UPI000C0440F4|nr:uncharacterized protein LOC111346053 isoform X2 [Stylophora pistillata]